MKIVLLTYLILVLSARQIAEQQVGVKEKGKNRGEKIKEYLASVDLKEGNPYCYAGIYYCFEQASRRTNLPNPLLKTGLVLRFWNFARKNGKKVKFEVKENELLIWNRKNTVQGHIGLVRKVGRKGWVETIEFNTSSHNPREGDGVHRKWRSVYHPLGFLYLKGIVGWEFK